MEHPTHNPYPQGPNHGPSPEVQAWLEQYQARAAERQQAEAATRRGRFRKAVVAGAGVLAIGAGATVAGLLDRGDSAPEAPHEIAVAGTLDMGKLNNQLDSQDFELARLTGSKEFDIPVVQLREYTAVPGLKNEDGGAFRGTSLTPSVSNEFEEKLDDVVSANADILNYLADTDTVTTIRFSVATDPKALEQQQDGDMQFIPASEDEYGVEKPAEIAYVLPAVGSVEATSAATMLRHEATHLVQRPLAMIDKIERVGEEKTIEHERYTDDEAYSRDLEAIRTASIDAAENDAEVQAAAQQMLEVNKNLHNPVAQVQKEIAQAILDGTYDKLQPTEEKPSTLKDFKLDAGRLSAPSWYQYYDSALADDADIKPTEAQDGALTQLDKAFYDAIGNNTDSPLAAFKESTYLQTSESDGHPEANTSEISASSMNVMMSFPRQLAARLKQLPAGAKKASLSFLKRLSNDTAMVVASQPVQSPLSKDIQDKASWVEREAA